jgi:hypothetical protein
MSTVLMYDSTSPWDIPRDAPVIAYYVDGLYAWPQAWLDMFPNAQKISISAIGQKTAQVGDVEVGCIWPPANAVPWVRRARAAGIDPTIYANELNDWLAVRQAFWAAGEPEPHYLVARYNGVREIPAGAIGRQFAHPHDGDGIADKPWETGGHFDLSIVSTEWLAALGGNDMSAEGEKQILKVLGDAYENTSEGEKTIGTRIKGLDRAVGSAYDPKTGTDLGLRVKNTESAVERIERALDRLETSGVPSALTLSADDKQDIARLVVAEMKKEGN